MVPRGAGRRPAEPRVISAFLSFLPFLREILYRKSLLISHGFPAPPPSSPHLPGRQAAIHHLAPPRQSPAQLLPAARQTQCLASFCLDRPAPRRGPQRTALSQAGANRSASDCIHPVQRRPLGASPPAPRRGPQRTALSQAGANRSASDCIHPVQRRTIAAL